MRTLTASAFALALAMSPAALAQGQQGGGAQQPAAQQPTSQKPAGQQQEMHTRTHQQVEAALKRAGIESVKTLDAAYLVSAVTKEGEQVTFVVDPQSAMAAGSGSGGTQASGQGQAAPRGGQGQQQAGMMGQQQIKDDLTKAGFTNVQILDANYLATGKTRNGDQITMMIDPSAEPGSAMSGGKPK